VKEYLQSKFYSISYYLEIFISLILTLVIVLLSCKLLINVFDFDTVFSNGDSFAFFLENAMGLAVGVELIKMLCKHSPGTVIEVLLFAIARQIVVAHSSVLNTFIGVICIAILFATRKYLFIAHDDVTRITLAAGHSVRRANFLAKVHIPLTDGATLREVMENRIQLEDKIKEVGTCIDYDNFALCIASIEKDRIKSIDILKTN
jgi:hypothetical protein